MPQFITGEDAVHINTIVMRCGSDNGDDEPVEAQPNQMAFCELPYS